MSAKSAPDFNWMGSWFYTIVYKLEIKGTLMGQTWREFNWGLVRECQARLEHQFVGLSSALVFTVTTVMSSCLWFCCIHELSPSILKNHLIYLIVSRH